VATKNWKLSPSDFAFLWEDCKRCYYLKVVSSFNRPHTIMPKVFNVIDRGMKAAFANRHTREILSGMPPGVLCGADEWVESAPITAGGHRSSCFLRGKLDTMVQCDDGSYAVIDFKSSTRNEEHISLYARQLHAYAYGLENPAAGHGSRRRVTRMGLLVFEPTLFSQSKSPAVSLAGGLSWIEIPRDDASFLQFLSEVLDVLEKPAPPGGSPSCEWCAYRDASRRTGL
jgi:hypothetical protein